MQYEATSPDEYLNLLDHDWRREKILAIRELLFRLGPELHEGIEYKMLSYRLGQQSILALNAQKGYVSLYVGNIKKVDTQGQILQNVKMGKGCIRLSKSVRLEETRLEQFLSKLLEMARTQQDIGCH